MRLIHSSISRKQVYELLVVLIFLNWPTILVAIFPQISHQKLPSALNLFPAIIAWFLLARIRCPYSRLLGYVWLMWYFVGVLNTLASSLVLGSYYGNLKLQEATEIYFWGCVFYFTGLLLYERHFAKNNSAIYGLPISLLNIHPLLGLLLLMFPMVWLSSIYLALGYIPILRGVNIVDDMYEIDYGSLYPYGSCLVISILYAGFRSMNASTIKYRAIYAFLTITFILISMADGKRAFAMVSLGGLVGISFKLFKQKTWSQTLPIFACTMLIMYVGVLLLRVGDGNAITLDAYERMMLVGAEFRDFVYTVNFAKPGQIQNYSWGTSTLASMTNGVIMKVLGLNKTALVDMDSAHAWAAIWNSNFGIRTGILSELWFSYEIGAMPILILYGFLSGFIIKKFRLLKSVRGMLFLASIFGLLLLNITSQSTFTAGVLPVFLYIYVTMRIGNYLLNQLGVRRTNLSGFGNTLPRNTLSNNGKRF